VRRVLFIKKAGNHGSNVGRQLYCRSLKNLEIGMFLLVKFRGLSNTITHAVAQYVFIVIFSNAYFFMVDLFQV